MSTQRFKKEFEVHYHEVDPYEEATPLTLLYYLEDTAIAHSEAVGVGVERLKSEGLAWILNRWHLQMEHYPKRGEKVVIETWPSKFERFYATREFLIKDSKQKVVGQASSQWIFFNTQKKRPLRIGSEYQEVYGLSPLRAIEDPFEQLQTGEGKKEGEQIFAVRRGDIDTNGHVNNANYLQWILEAVPEDIYRDHRLISLEIMYKKETTYGSSIQSNCYVERSEPMKDVCTHKIISSEMAQELALAKTVWRKQK